MKELGQRLREKREALGIDLDQLQTMTKIRKRYLKALEDGDWSILPGDVYARGFVRSYAESVGLDGKELLDTYLARHPTAMETDQPDEESTAPVKRVQSDGARVEQSKPQSATPIAPVVKPPLRRSAQRPQRGRKGSSTGGQVAAVAAVLIVLGGAWWFLGKHANPSSGNLPNTALGGQANESAVSNTLPGNTSAPAATGNGTANNATVGNPPAQPQVKVVAQPFQNNTQSYTVTTTQPIAVVLSAANDDCWVKVTSDGNVVDASDTVTKGQTKTWQANQSIMIRVGFPPGVTMTINGQTITLPNTSNAIDVQVLKAQT